MTNLWLCLVLVPVFSPFIFVFDVSFYVFVFHFRSRLSLSLVYCFRVFRFCFELLESLCALYIRIGTSKLFAAAARSRSTRARPRVCICDRRTDLRDNRRSEKANDRPVSSFFHAAAASYVFCFCRCPLKWAVLLGGDARYKHISKVR